MSNSTPPRAVLSDDTSTVAERSQFEIWRSLSTVQIAEIIVGASNALRTVAMAGLRNRYPAATDRELLVRYAALTLGPTLARRVYPEFDRFDP